MTAEEKTTPATPRRLVKLRADSDCRGRRRAVSRAAVARAAVRGQSVESSHERRGGKAARPSGDYQQLTGQHTHTSYRQLPLAGMVP